MDEAPSDRAAARLGQLPQRRFTLWGGNGKRAAVAVLSLVVGAIVVFPAFRSPPRDSYPLSNYPMFSGQIETTSTIHTVVGRTAVGERQRLTPELIADSDEVIHASGTVNRLVGSGRADELCADVADRIARRGPAQVVAVQVLTETVDAVQYFNEDTLTVAAIVAECEVPR